MLKSDCINPQLYFRLNIEGAFDTVILQIWINLNNLAFKIIEVKIYNLDDYLIVKLELVLKNSIFFTKYQVCRY